MSATLTVIPRPDFRTLKQIATCHTETLAHTIHVFWDVLTHLIVFEHSTPEVQYYCIEQTAGIKSSLECLCNMPRQLSAYFVDYRGASGNTLYHMTDIEALNYITYTSWSDLIDNEIIRAINLVIDVPRKSRIDTRARRTHMFFDENTGRIKKINIV